MPVRFTPWLEIMLFGSENLLRGRPVLPQVLKLPARENSLLHCPTLSGYMDTSADCKPPDGSLVDNVAISCYSSSPPRIELH